MFTTASWLMQVLQAAPRCLQLAWALLPYTWCVLACRLAESLEQARRRPASSSWSTWPTWGVTRIQARRRPCLALAVGVWRSRCVFVGGCWQQEREGAGEVMEVIACSAAATAEGASSRLRV